MGEITNILEKSDIYSKSYIEDSLSAEALDAEKSIQKIFKVMLLMLCIFNLFYFVYSLLKGQFSLFFLYFLVYIFFVFLYNTIILSKIKNAQNIKLLKVFNVTIEISTVTVSIYFLSKFLPIEDVLSGPLLMGYILMVLMTGFRYSMKLSFFAAILAAVEFLIVHYTLVRGVSAEISSIIIDLSGGGIFQKVLYILLSGFVSGMLATNTKNISRKIAVSSYEQYQIKNTFGQYVSNEVRDYILSGEFDLTGDEKFGCILFSDLRNFTTIMERTDAKDMVNQLNEYFSGMVDVIGENKGVVNKFIGDAILAVFGLFDEKDDKKEIEQSEKLAVRAALGMQKKLLELNKKWEAEGKEPLCMGIGLDAGNFITGNVGDEDRMEFTCIGSVVNSAMSIEELTKKYRSKVIVSGRLYSKLKNNQEFSFNMLSESEKINDNGEDVSLYEVT